jgi:hypothetical protein
MNNSSYSNDGERSDDANAIAVDYDEDRGDDDHPPMVDSDPEVQSGVTNEATSMTDTSCVVEGTNFRNSTLVFNDSGTQDANNGSNSENNQESKEDPVLEVMYMTDPFAPPKPEYEKNDMEVRRDEEMRRVAKMSADEQDDVLTLRDKGFEGLLFDEHGGLTDEVRLLLTEPDITLWEGLSLHFDTKDGV